MRILLIDLDAPAADPAFKSATHQLACLWSAMGHAVTFVLSSHANAGSSLPPPEPGLRHIFLKAPPARKSTLWKSLDLLAARWSLSNVARRVMTSDKPDIVMAASKIQVDNYAAVRIVRDADAVFVRHTEYLLSLTLSQLAETLGKQPPQPWFQLLQRAERVAYRHAKMVATTFPTAFDHMQKHGLDRERWICLPHDDLSSLAPLYIRMFEELRSK